MRWPSLFGFILAVTLLANAFVPPLWSGSSVTATATHHSVSLKWKDAATNLKGYNIYRRTPAAKLYTKVNPKLVGAKTYIDTTVVATVTYVYAVTAVDAINRESSKSSTATIRVP